MDPTIDLGRAHLRVARPTDDLDAVVRFYREGLGFAVLGHDGFDGVMLGHPGAAYHLPDQAGWQRAVDRLTGHGHQPVKSSNPYWDRKGVTFEDPDGYRGVLQNAAWPG